MFSTCWGCSDAPQLSSASHHPEFDWIHRPHKGVRIHLQRDLQTIGNKSEGICDWRSTVTPGSHRSVASIFPPLSLCRHRNCISATLPPRPVWPSPEPDASPDSCAGRSRMAGRCRGWSSPCSACWICWLIKPWARTAFFQLSHHSNVRARCTCRA